MTKKLAIIAGRGPLPKAIITACVSQQRHFHVIAINGETDPEILNSTDHSWHDLAAIGGVLDKLEKTGCGEVCMVGPISRPDFTRLRPDFTGLKLLPKAIAAARRGDDAILSVVVKVFEDAGIDVVAAEAVVQSLAIVKGDLAATVPSDNDFADIRRGREILATLGPYDIGQAAVIRNGQVLALEAAEGTDEMLVRCRDFRVADRGGVLVKLPKAGQERRVDLPAVGLTTLENVLAAGLNGIALETGGALIVDRDAVIARANAEGLFVHALGSESQLDDDPVA